MSMFHGMLLFDIADPDIGNWEENLGYRGMLDVWENKAAHLTLLIQTDEDTGEEEVWVHDDKGNHETLGYFDEYNDAIAYAKRFMQVNARIMSWREMVIP